MKENNAELTVFFGIKFPMYLISGVLIGNFVMPSLNWWINAPLVAGYTLLGVSSSYNFFNLAYWGLKGFFRKAIKRKRKAKVAFETLPDGRFTVLYRMFPFLWAYVADIMGLGEPIFFIRKFNSLEEAIEHVHKVRDRAEEELKDEQQRKIEKKKKPQFHSQLKVG